MNSATGCCTANAEELWLVQHGLNHRVSDSELHLSWKLFCVKQHQQFFGLQVRDNIPLLHMIDSIGN